MSDPSSLQRGSLSHWDGALAGCVFAVCFAFFMVIVIVAQLLFLNWRSWLPGAEDAKSITGGVSAAVYTLLSHIP